jgi:hypothetical protein
VEILGEVMGVVVEGILEFFLEGVSADAANLGRDLSAIRKGKRQPAWRIEKHVC